jgi:hypothetical protein
LNYQTYKTLTPELKEEYNYRFKDKFYRPEIRSLMWMTIFLTTIFSLFIMIVYLAQKEYLEVDTQSILSTIAALNGVVLIVLISYVLIWIAELASNMINYGLWIRKNNIKFKRIWRREK